MRAEPIDVYVSIGIDQDYDRRDSSKQVRKNIHTLIMDRSGEAGPALHPGAIRSCVAGSDVRIVFAPVLDLIPVHVPDELLCLSSSIIVRRRRVALLYLLAHVLE